MPRRGAYRDRHGMRGGMRWTRQRRRFCARRLMLTRTAKSRGPGLPTLRQSSQAAQRTARERRGQQSPVPGEPVQAVTPLRWQGRNIRLNLWSLPHVFSLHGGHGYQSIPGLPCALCSLMDRIPCITRARRATGMRTQNLNQPFDIRIRKRCRHCPRTGCCSAFRDQPASAMPLSWAD
jgi:hypothetical protein